MWPNVAICIVVTLCGTYVTSTDVEYDGQVTLKLQHALDHVVDPIFIDRGSISIHSIRTGALAVSQNPLGPTERAKLKELNRADGLYRLKATAITADKKETSFLTFVKGCSLYESHLSDTLTVTLDHAGAVVAVSMSTSPSMCEGRPTFDEDLKNFNTTVFVRHMEQGPVPDTAAYIQKQEKEKEARERGETKDNRSFFAKYWMYIVPVLIFVVLSGAANPDGAGGR